MLLDCLQTLFKKPIGSTHKHSLQILYDFIPYLKYFRCPGLLPILSRHIMQNITFAWMRVLRKGYRSCLVTRFINSSWNRNILCNVLHLFPCSKLRSSNLVDGLSFLRSSTNTVFAHDIDAFSFILTYLRGEPQFFLALAACGQTQPTPAV